MAACSLAENETAWQMDSEVAFYGDYFAERPRLRRNVLENISSAAITQSYRWFAARLPHEESIREQLVYYEVGAAADHYFFYWSGLIDGKCVAYYTSQSVEYAPIEICHFPSDTPTSLDTEGDELDRIHGSFIGLVVWRPNGSVTRRYVVPPTNVPIGDPRIRLGAEVDVGAKIEALTWYRATSR